MHTPLPDWSELKSKYDQLLSVPTDQIDERWVADWSDTYSYADEIANVRYVATTVDTSDEEAEKLLSEYYEVISPEFEQREEAMKRKFVESGVNIQGLEIPKKQFEVDLQIFREKNLAIESELGKKSIAFNKITGSQTVDWEGEEITMPQVDAKLSDPDRSIREKAWRKGRERQLKDRDSLNKLFGEFLDLRTTLAENADLNGDYRAFMFKNLHRFDYTPEDCLSFHQAIEETVVPLVSKLNERRRTALGVDTLRPWDLDADPEGRPGLKPFENADQMVNRTQRLFDRMNPELARHFADMHQSNVLDLESRNNKAPGGYCTSFAKTGKPFIFMNSAGRHDDLMTLLHEAGHAFHVYEALGLKYEQQRHTGSEFAEVASMSMEHIGSELLDDLYEQPEERMRAHAELAERQLRFWPYMAVVDAFQHWVYENPAEAKNPSKCDEKWRELWRRFMPGIDFTGLEEIEETGWHRKLHIFVVPFYYIEYGLAQMGAIQVWQNYLKSPENAISKYRSALALGGTRSLPDLFQAAGAKFAFDAATLSKTADALYSKIPS